MEQTQNKEKYEANRTELSFQHGWKSSRPWLAFEDGQMTSDMHSLICVTYGTTSSNNVDPDRKYFVILFIVCH